MIPWRIKTMERKAKPMLKSLLMWLFNHGLISARVTRRLFDRFKLKEA